MAVPLAVLRILLLFVYICEVAAYVIEYVTGDRGIKEIDLSNWWWENDSKLGRCQCHVVIVMRWQHCTSSTISHPLYSILSIFGAPFSLHISLPNLFISLPYLAMSSATITNKSESNTAHPLESFCSSTDYQHFESSVIQPFLFQAKLCDSVNIHHRTSLSFAPAPGCPSLDGLIKLLSETDYNNTTSMMPLPAPSHSDVSSAQVEGYFSWACPDYFIWESGYFEEGSVLFLDGSSRLVKSWGSVE